MQHQHDKLKALDLAHYLWKSLFRKEFITTILEFMILFQSYLRYSKHFLLFQL
jgi:hypothetical protein